MIVVRLVGRLGNQLFQYATAKALALRLGVGVGLDARHYSLRRRRDLGILSFKLGTEPVRHAELPPKEGRLRIFVNNPRNRFTIFRETQQSFDRSVHALPDWTYLIGYFQNENYFSEYADDIRDELTKFPISHKRNNEILRSISESNSVSIHARRGDYVGSSRFDVMRPTYYADAIRRILDSVPGKPEFYVFSDDPAWAEANIRPPSKTTYVRNTGPAYVDLRLMSSCKHHVIANSSFSWWGAWLRHSPQKVVIAPKVWKNAPGFDVTDIVPAYWTRI